VKAKGGNTLSINANGAFFKRSGMPLITMARYIYDIDTQQYLGLLVINLTPKVLDSAISNLGNDRAICFFDREGNVLSGDDTLKDSFKQAFVGSGFSWELIRSGGKNQILSAYSTEDSPIVQVSLSDVSGSGIQSWENVWLAITLIAAVILAVFSSGVFISLNITRPLDKLSEGMVNTKSEGLLHEIDLPQPDNEIRRLGESYNDMVVHNNKLIAELIEKEKSVQKAELRTLQEQIKPHFLYNSLETISYMALQSNAPKVHDALETLGSFYRNFLSKGSRDIPLRNEILIVKDYLALQKLRYGNVFDDQYEVEESVLDIMIPKLILQPLVENSLYHGVRLKGEKGVIRISAFGRGENVHIAVYDSGVGMTQEQINEILKSDIKDENALSGFGLKGTIERIRYYYNYCAIINIRSEQGEYTEIEIIVPAKDRQGGGVNV
jgi:two-component system sensor histidine kinase YesM